MYKKFFNKTSDCISIVLNNTEYNKELNSNIESIYYPIKDYCSLLLSIAKLNTNNNFVILIEVGLIGASIISTKELDETIKNRDYLSNITIVNISDVNNMMGELSRYYLSIFGKEITDPDIYDAAIDFDGVIHSYTSGFMGHDKILDPPVNGAIEFLYKAIVSGMKIAIHTTRGTTLEGTKAIKDWLAYYGLDQKIIDNLVITNKKIHAKIYIDDRGYCFRGFFPSLAYIKEFKSWNKKHS